MMHCDIWMIQLVQIQNLLKIQILLKQQSKCAKMGDFSCQSGRHHTT